MIEKVKVSQEIAEALGIRLGKGIPSNILKHHITDGWSNPINKALNDLSVDDLARALYIGYEVEPEYKKGDFVVNTRENTIYEVYSDGRNDCYHMERDGEEYHHIHKDYLRHATESEIAQEKERRFFARYGRKPWELREGDVLQNKHTGLAHIRVVAEIVDGEPRFEFNETGIDYKRNFHVVCFAEDRLDY